MPAGRVVLVAAVSLLRVLAGLLLELLGNEQAQQHGHDHDQHQASDELGERELPADQHPHDDPQLEDEVRRGELEGQRGGG